MNEINDVLSWRVLPAPLGYTLWCIDEKTSEIFGQEPIIGWTIEQRRTADGKHYYWWKQPIVVTMHDMDECEWLIQFPDGRVEMPEERLFDSLEKAREHLAERQRDKASR